VVRGERERERKGERETLSLGNFYRQTAAARGGEVVSSSVGE